MVRKSPEGELLLYEEVVAQAMFVAPADPHPPWRPGDPRYPLDRIRVEIDTANGGELVVVRWWLRPEGQEEGGSE